MQTQEIDSLAAQIAAVLLGVLALWVLIAVAAVLAAHALRGRGRVRAVAVARRTLPRWLFRLTVGAIGAGIALAPAAAGAAPRPLPPPGLPVTFSVSTPNLPAPGLPTTRPTPAAAVPAPAATAAPAPPPRPVGRPAPAETVTVRPGDTLWGIASRHLGERAGGPAVAAEWPRWWAANRSVIGHDPGVIHPGQHLSAPTAGHR
jgi:nucleoid-associated protein YgaU